MKKIIAGIAFLLTGVMSYGQHMEDIQKKLYPGFDRIKWSEQYIESADYYPIDYSEWEVSPKSDDFSEAFTGYYILDRFLRKRNRELMQGLDEKGKAAYAARNRAWQAYRDKGCNKKWKASENGYSMMVLDYLYCVNTKTRQRVDSLGGGIPAKDNVSKLPALEHFRLGSEFSTFDSLVFDANGDEGRKNYYSTRKVIVAGVIGDPWLSFKNGKLHTVRVKFNCGCGSMLNEYINKNVGDPNINNFEPITMVSNLSWRGLKEELSISYGHEDKIVWLSLHYR